MNRSVHKRLTDAFVGSAFQSAAGLRPGVDADWKVGGKLKARPHFGIIRSGRRMSKEDSIEVTGTVVEKFPSGLFSVQLDQDRTVLAHLAGKLRRNRIRVLAGDRVTLELSPYDLTKGRITYRHK
jgi:translation initiation factor IF-1